MGTRGLASRKPWRRGSGDGGVGPQSFLRGGSLLLVKEGENNLLMGLVLMGEIMVQETAAELCHPTQGGGRGWVLGGLRMSHGASHRESGGVQDMLGVGPAVWGLWGGCVDSRGAHGTSGGLGWPPLPTAPPLPSVLACPVPGSPSRPHSPHSATWTSPLIWTSKASCASCPVPPTTGCAEAASGFSHPGRAGPARAQGLQRS